MTLLRVGLPKKFFRIVLINLGKSENKVLRVLTSFLMRTKIYKKTRLKI